MLLANTIVKPSQIAGMGLFANEVIKKGEVIWRYTNGTTLVFTLEQLNALKSSYDGPEAPNMRYYLTYGYYAAKFDGIIVCLDNGRFVNHSEAPNIGFSSELSEDQSWQYSVALRDIKKGEELLENYRTYDSADWIDELWEEYGIFNPSQGHKTRIHLQKAGLAGTRIG